MKVVFITESSYDLGLGHLSRCLSVAHEFEKDKVFEIEFVIPEIDDKTCEILKGHNFVYNFAAQRLNYLLSSEKSSFILIVDVKTSFYDEFLEKMYEKSVQIFGIDDLSHRNILYTANFSPPAAVIPNTFELDQREKNYLGWKWVPIHKPASKEHTFQAKRKEVGTLLLFGGSDPEGLSAPSLSYFGRHLPEDKFTLICGPLMKQSEIVECAQISKMFGNLSLIKSPLNLSKLMDESFHSVTTFGHTFYELIAHGNNPLGIYRDIDDIPGLFTCPELVRNNLISIAQYRMLLIEKNHHTFTRFLGTKRTEFGSVDPVIQELSHQLSQGALNIKTRIFELM